MLSRRRLLGLSAAVPFVAVATVRGADARPIADYRPFTQAGSVAERTISADPYPNYRSTKSVTVLTEPSIDITVTDIEGTTFICTQLELENNEILTQSGGQFWFRVRYPWDEYSPLFMEFPFYAKDPREDAKMFDRLAAEFFDFRCRWYDENPLGMPWRHEIRT